MNHSPVQNHTAPARAILPIVLILMILASLLPAASLADSVEPEKVKISGSHWVAKGLHIQLTASVSPEKALQKVIWSSSKPKIAKVSKKGRVTGLAEGSAVITAASAENAKVKKTWKITVTAKAATRVKITAESKTIDLAGEKTLQLTAKALPSKSAAQSFTWKSSDFKIASVSSKGLVTAKKVGRVTVTATARDGSGKKAAFTITVKDTTPPKYYALLIANWEYTDMGVLKGPPKDIQAWRNLIAGLSQPWQVTEKHNLHARQILSSISSAFRNATERDICMLIYVGHGENDSDVDPGALLGIHYGESDFEDCVTTGKLTSALKKACPGKVFVILESCGSGSFIYDGGETSWMTGANRSSGAFARGVVNAFRSADEQIVSNYGEMRTGKFTVLAACEHGDTSVQLPLTKKMEAGIFDYCLITALGCKYPSGAYTGTAPADKNGDGSFTLSELFQGANTVYADLKTRYHGLTQVFQHYGDPDQVLFTR